MDAARPSLAAHLRHGFPRARTRGPGHLASPAPRRYPAGSHALLAQLVEHFHGKEGVAGSSPAEGSLEAAAYGGFFAARKLLRSTARRSWDTVGTHRHERSQRY